MLLCLAKALHTYYMHTQHSHTCGNENCVEQQREESGAPRFELPRSSRDPRVAGFKDVWDCSLRRFIFSRQYSESALGEHVDDLLVNAVSMH